MKLDEIYTYPNLIQEEHLTHASVDPYKIIKFSCENSLAIMERESAVICIDNSEWMRNGDLVPTRLQCQQDAVNLVMQCKLRANPENGVGLLSMAE
jgi:hypothetical protein